MILLVSGASATHRRYWENPYFGHLVMPRAQHSLKLASESGKPWGVDNDAFGGWTDEKETRFSALLGQVCLRGPKQSCKFVACPDVVGDSRTTLERFDRWEPIIRATGFPVALVAQDGLTPRYVPWDRIDALFIGGTDEFKLSQTVDSLIEYANFRNKWVHVGRVNSNKRIRHFYEIGVDSIDGRQWSAWPDTYWPKYLNWLGQLQVQPCLNFEQPTFTESSI